MEIGEIINNAIRYPMNNIQSMIIYLILGIIMALILIFTGLSGTTAAGKATVPSLALALIGIILTIIVFLVIEGYGLDIIKIGINKGEEGPSINFARQTINGAKLLVVNAVYFIIPLLIVLALAIFLQGWIVTIIGIIIYIIFDLAGTMAECRLAQTEDLNYALSVGDALEDIARIGYVKVILTVIAVALISFIITSVLYFIFSLINTDVATIVVLLAGIYLYVFDKRATGLLYSDI